MSIRALQLGTKLMDCLQFVELPRISDRHFTRRMRAFPRQGITGIDRRAQHRGILAVERESGRGKLAILEARIDGARHGCVTSPQRCTCRRDSVDNVRDLSRELDIWFGKATVAAHCVSGFDSMSRSRLQPRSRGTFRCRKCRNAATSDSACNLAVAGYHRTSPSAREHPRDARLAEQDHHFRCRDLGDCAETCPTGETGAVLPRETRVDRIPYLLQHSIDETALRLSRCHWLPCWRTTAQPRELQPARGRSTSMVVHTIQTGR